MICGAVGAVISYVIVSVTTDSFPAISLNFTYIVLSSSIEEIKNDLELVTSSHIAPTKFTLSETII
ncbi:hypothetical protein D3C76_102170 [compost metagenome]